MWASGKPPSLYCHLWLLMPASLADTRVLAGSRTGGSCSTTALWTRGTPGTGSPSRCACSYSCTREAKSGAEGRLVQVTLPVNDPLYQLKRSLVQRHGMASQQTFQLARDQVCLACGMSKLAAAKSSDTRSLRHTGAAAAPVQLPALRARL